MVRAFTDGGLASIQTALEPHVARGDFPGVVALVHAGGDTHAFAIGQASFGAAPPMRRDSIFRIASMTKPVTAAAAMMLIEDGKLTLTERVDRLLPELADRRVLRAIDARLDETVPAQRAMTVEDLLTFREGWGVVLAPPGTYPIQKAIAELGIVGFGLPNPTMPFGPDEWLRRLATLPLMAQPGERWLYTTGSNILGVLIARASGMPLETFFQERIFAPLGMNDTAFSVPAGRLDRFVSAYRAETGKPVLYDDADQSRWARPPLFPEGDSGLVSTVDDYLAFGLMIRDMGRYGGRQIIPERAVAAMVKDQLTPTQRDGGRVILCGHGWGYGVSVVVEPGDLRSPGTFGWNGGLGTSWICDPARGLTAILLTQRLFESPEPPAVHKDFWAAAYSAIAD